MLLSVIMPVFNEAEVLPLTLQRLRSVLQDVSWQYELLFVDDGSRDNSAAIIRAEGLRDPRIKLLSFARNFGHQAAITAGLDCASGDAVVVMDCDLQDPPELIPLMLQRINEGYDVVSAQRARRDSDTWFKRSTANLFYWLMQRLADKRIQPEVGDFRMFSASAVKALRQFREQHRFMRGLVAWLGLREALVPFDRQPRAAGETKYPLHKMLRFAWTAITSFSAVPLKLSMAAGVMLTFVGLAYIPYAIMTSTVRGWASIIALQCIFSGFTLLALGLIGDYVAKIYEESKRRPLYVVDNTCNLTLRSDAVDRAIVVMPYTRVQGQSYE
jgi:dolichol-phosphate mannosyltransferase